MFSKSFAKRYFEKGEEKRPMMLMRKSSWSGTICLCDSCRARVVKSVAIQLYSGKEKRVPDNSLSETPEMVGGDKSASGPRVWAARMRR
ncbi:hypothetical protein RIF29_09779 [Crotalaria pallida]|uniref:Uncharacterized protein n=1 Tax=Crotalaria pallida TaxID=3830 RepID=A0AAN9FVA0_CROPI